MMLIDTNAPASKVGIRRGPATSRRGGAVDIRPARADRSRPAGAPVRHRGAGVAMCRTPHRPQSVKPITPVTTVALALIAAAITVWLGLIAQFGADRADGTSTVPDQLAVVRVQSGENLQQLAARVAPDAPTGQVIARIRELNSLESVALDAGQPLIAPIG